MSQLSKVINQRFIEAKTAINIKLQISSFLADNGITVESNKRICCPLHDDSTPSFSVNFNTNEWKCFGCPDGGHYADIWMKLTNKRTGSKYTIYSAIEQILKLNPSICDELGFKTIYETYDEEFDLFKETIPLAGEKETSIFSFDEKLKQPPLVRQTETITIKAVMDKLKSADITTIIQFITDCEIGMSSEALIAKYYYEQNIPDYISSISLANVANDKDTLLGALSDD